VPFRKPGAEDVAQGGDEQVNKERILNEVRLHRWLSAGCSDIVRYAFAHSVQDGLLVVMERCDLVLWDAPLTGEGEPSSSSSSSSSCGPPLSLAVGGGERSESSLAEAQRLALASQLASAVRHCHGLRVLHRDVNPWNVFLVRQEGSRLPFAARLGDLGLAARLPAGEDELRGVEGAVDFAELDASALGSMYSAPELGATYGLPADVFSVGMTLLAMWAAAGSADVDVLVSATEVAKKAAVDGQDQRVLGADTPPLPNTVLPTARPLADEAVGPVLSAMLRPAPGARPSIEEVCEAFNARRLTLGGEEAGISSMVVEATAAPPKPSAARRVLGSVFAARRFAPWKRSRT